MALSTMMRMAFVSLVLSTGTTSACAEVAPGQSCPPDFSCFLVEPRDGACPHPAVVLDEASKSTKYDGDRFSRAYEKACIAKTSSAVIRRDLRLRLKFGNGSSRTYKDTHNQAQCEQHQDSCILYVLYDYFPEHGLFLVHVGYNENQQWLLLNQLDGSEREIIAPPGYSPGKRWLASVYATDGGDDGNNGVDIFPANPRAIEPEFHYRPNDYEMWVFVGWDGDSRLLLKVTSWVDKELVTAPAEVVLANGKWQLNRSAPASARP